MDELQLIGKKLERENLLDSISAESMFPSAIDEIRNSIGDERKHDNFLSLLYPKDEMLLIHIPQKSAPGSFGIRNLILLSSSSGKVKNFTSELKKTADFISFRNKFYEIRIQSETGIISHISLSDGKENIIGHSGIYYSIEYNHLSLFDKIKEKILKHRDIHLLQTVEKIEIIERGPLRFSILITFQPDVSGNQIATRLSFYETSPYIFGESILKIYTPKYKIDLTVPLSDLFSSENKLFIIGKHFTSQNLTLSKAKELEKPYFPILYKDYFAVLNSHTQHSLTEFSGKSGTSGIQIITQNRHYAEYRNARISIPIYSPKEILSQDKKVSHIDIEEDLGPKWSDQGISRISWIINPLNNIPDLNTLTRTAKELNNPMIAIPTFSIHNSTEFVKCDADNVIITAVKEIEPYLRSAPKWFHHPSMNELPFIIRSVELEGKSTSCKITIAPEIEFSHVQEVDLLERVNESLINSDISVDKNIISFDMNPYEIKTIFILGKISYDED